MPSTQQLVGGLIGTLANSAWVSNSHASGAVRGDGGYAGGLIGASGGATITNVYATGTVQGATASSFYFGGLIGEVGTGMVIADVYATGQVGTVAKPVRYAGGLIGIMDGNGDTLTQAYATGAVFGADSAGGLVGYVNSPASPPALTQVYATGAVTVATQTTSAEGGALIGHASAGSVDQGWASGAVNAVAGATGVSLGGFVGFGTLTTTNSYWDSYSTGQSAANGSATQTGVTAVTSDPELRTAFATSSYGNLTAANWVFFDSLTRPFLSFEVPTTGAALVNAHQLQLVNANATTLAGSYTLANNIDLAEAGRYIAGTPGSYAGMWDVGGWVPIGTTAGGTSGAGFSGNLNGAGYSLTNLTITEPFDNIGLFGVTAAGSTIRNLTVTGTISGHSNVGGLVGSANGSLTDVVSHVAVSAGDTAGGLAGSSSGTVTNAIATGDVETSGLSGGLIGYQSAGQVTNASASGTVFGATTVGGLIGYAGYGTIVSLSYATGSASSYGDTAGGLIGQASGAVSQVYATGAVSSGNNYGGIIGYQDNGSTLSNARFSTDNAQGSDAVGSANGTSTNVVGYTNAQLEDYTTYATVWSGFDFRHTWSPPTLAGQAGQTAAYLPQLYALSPVAWAKGDTSTIYGNAIPTDFAQFSGGTYTYAFGPIGDTLALDLGGLTAAVAGSNAGTYAETLNQAAGTLTSSGGIAYRVIVNQTPTLTITPRPVYIYARNASSIYGNAVALTYVNPVGANYGLVNGDILSGALASAGTSASNVGSYAITQGTLAAGSNYAIVYSPGTVTITPRPLHLYGQSGAGVYGNTPSITFVTGQTTANTGLVNGDTITGAAGGVNSATGVGTYTTTAGTLSAGGNYALNWTGAGYTITPRPLYIVARTTSSIYGNDPAAALSYVANVGANYGLVNGDTLTGALATGATATSHVGTYGITQGTLAASSNYTLSFTSGNVTIAPRDLYVYGQTGNGIYGNTPVLTYVVAAPTASTGLVNGNVIYGTPTGVFATSDVGTYTTTIGKLTAGSNYRLNWTGASYTVLTRPVYVYARDISSIYGNTPVLTYVVASGTTNGLVNADTLTGALASTGTATSNIGNYAINQGSLAASANYAINFYGATLTIAPRPLYIVARDVDWYTGRAMPALTYVVVQATANQGLVNGDTTAGALATAATGTSPPGPYAITQGTVAASSNYTVTFKQGTLTRK